MNELETDRHCGTQRFRVADWSVDPDAHTISRGSHVDKLEPKAMRVLAYLASRAGTVVRREELETEVWSGTVVGYDALSNAIIKIRKAFGDRAREPRVIQTVSKSGYRLIAPVSGDSGTETDQDVTAARGLAGTSHLTAAPALPKGPSIAVLAFENLSADREQDYLSHGLAEDIIIDLSKLSGLFVIARHSSFSYRGSRTNSRTVSRELGVRFILDGSVRKLEQSTRVSVHLVDGTTGGQVWAERYDLVLTGLFDLQDKIRRDIVEALELTMSAVEAIRLDRRGTENEEAYHCFLRGREQDRLDTREANAQARSLFKSAIDRDPEFPDAHSYLSRNRAVCFINRWNTTLRNLMKDALYHAREAIRLDDSSPHAHFAAGASLLWMRRHDVALHEAETATVLDPNFSEGHALRGMVLLYSGRSAEAIESLRIAMRLDPHYRDAYLHIVAQAYFHAGRYHCAVDALQSRLIRKPDSDTSRVLLAAIYGHLGEIEKSRSEWARALQVNPHYSLEHKLEILPYKNAADFEHFATGLRKAGIA